MDGYFWIGQDRWRFTVQKPYEIYGNEDRHRGLDGMDAWKTSLMPLRADF